MSFKIFWYGHAALGLETGGYHILVDPYFTDNPAASTQADQVSADFILVTHGHGDHIGDAARLAKKYDATVVAQPEICEFLGLSVVVVRRDLSGCACRNCRKIRGRYAAAESVRRAAARFMERKERANA